MDTVDIVEVTTKTALVRSRVPGVEFAVNPYTGCGHGCAHCYAMFTDARYCTMPCLHLVRGFSLCQALPSAFGVRRASTEGMKRFEGESTDVGHGCTILLH
jgi:protein gp37